MSNTDQTTTSRLTFELDSIIQIEVPEVEERFKTTLVGVLPDEYLIFRIPPAISHVGIHQLLVPGLEMIVRYLCKGTVCGFRSTLRKAMLTPAQLMLVDYPSDFEVHDLRVHERIDCLIPAKLTKNGAEFDGVLRDLSLSGCRVSVKAPEFPHSEVEDEITVTCRLPTVEGRQLFPGVVRNMVKDQKGTELGIQFKGVAECTQQAIGDYFASVKDIFS